MTAMAVMTHELILYIFQQIKMKQVTLHSVKIKVINLHFRIRAISNPLLLKLYADEKLIDQQQVQLKQGMLASNLALVGQIKDTQISQSKTLTIMIFEKKTTTNQRIGLVTIPFNLLSSIKMQKFPLKNCFDNSAYLQAFILMLPSRIIDQQYEEDQRFKLNLIAVSPDKKAQREGSNVHIILEQEQSQMSLNTHPPKSKVLSKDSKEVETQTCNIESLLALNQILNDANEQLQQQNNQLKKQVSTLETILEMKTDIEDRQEELKNKIEELESSIMKRDFQLESKSQAFDILKREKDSLSRQIEVLRSNLNKDQFKIQHIVTELGKYAETAKKYRSNSVSLSRTNQVELKPVSIELQGSQTVRLMPNRSTRNRKDQLKFLLGSKDGLMRYDETIDTMRESGMNQRNN